MTEIYRLIFDCITDKLTLPLPQILEAVVMFIIGEIAYHYAYKKVGFLYRTGVISGKGAGKFLHWTIRIVFYVGAWAVVSAAVAYYNFFAVHGLLVFPLICVFDLVVYSIESLQKELNSNA